MEVYWTITLAVFGLVIGSFLNVVIYRLPHKIAFGFSRSACPQCGGTIRIWDNIPLLSYLILRGKCRDCRARIPLRYPVVEALNGGLYAGLYLLLGPGWELAMTCLISSALLVIVFIDLDHMIIPDAITLPGLAVGLAYSLTPAGIGIVPSLTGALVGGGGLYAVAYLGELIFRKESMGGGDIKMAAMLGAFVGWQKVILIFMGSAVVGLLVSLAVLPFSAKFRRSRMIPFGPFLAVAGLVALLYGDRLIAGYLALFVAR